MIAGISTCRMSFLGEGPSFPTGRMRSSETSGYSFEGANLAVRFGATWGTGAVKHRSRPARAPKTKLKPSVSQKWLRATLAGINGFGNSKTVVQQAKKSAAAKADSRREVWSIRTSGYRHPTYRRARNAARA